MRESRGEAGDGKIKYEHFENRLRWKDFEEIRKSHPPYLEATNYDGTDRDWSKAEVGPCS